ncbi:MAG: hypothetical protein ACM3KD_06250, partial [Hyphomicrobiaceae bacterium]
YGNNDFLRGGLGHLGVRIGHESILGGVALKAAIIRKATPTGKGGGPLDGRRVAKRLSFAALGARSSAG